tara:strand:+ start:1860 stop:2102 length:243 start_codon:yes stop_codon:yes gene_type:complete
MIYTKYSPEIIDKILSYTSISNKQKIDRLLEIDAYQYCNLGIDSTKTEKEEVKKNSRTIYRAISKIDYPTGKLFLEHQDK